jgi:Ca2+-binding EF-hand superfamily protein
LKYVFRTYDHDKDGVINKKEIDRMVKVNIWILRE